MSLLPPASQEVEGVGSGRTLGVTLSVLIFGALLSLGAAWLLALRAGHLEHAASVKEAPRPEREVSNIRSDLFRGPLAGERLKAAQRDKLEHFGWADPEHKLVRIPIDVAMDLEAQGAHLTQGAQP